ncbi:MAG: thrombospondin type 3 repeat-containing protein [Kiritimatiellia bacterium]|jgi:hypothetical protein|nr:thrombospondin type 3 repeat-containing protein [Kiritimatiellia bacterium]
MKFMKWLVIGLIAGNAASAWAFPSWMGVYGSYATHNGSNPGVYTILMNQDYSGLHAEVGIGISNNWTTHAMTYMGNADGNSLWQYYPGEALATNTTVYYYFHGWDDWGGNIYANNYGSNYSFVAGPAALDWIGATVHTPSSPMAGQDIKVWTETWPKGAGQSGYSLFEVDSEWGEVGLSKTTSTNLNDLWTGTLGRFLPGTALDYLVAVKDGAATTHYDNNSGNYYSVNVATGAPLSYLGGAYHWPTNGALGPTNSLWLNLFAAPSQTLVNAFAEYSVNAWIWERAPLDYWQMDGTNEWWHVELGLLPPSSTVWYAFDAQDGEATTVYRPANGLPYSAIVTGSSTDSDTDGLPDDWETFWFGSLTNATASGNPDGDGLPGMPLDNWMEYMMGSDPTVSNAMTEIAVLWKPSIPLQGGAMKISTASDVFDGLGVSSVTASFSDGRTATLVADSAGRFQNTVLLSGTSTVCKITSLSGGGQTDNNRGIGWTIPIQLLGGGELADTDGDGMPDAWELANGLDPFVDDANGDADGDGITNLQEYLHGLNSQEADPWPEIMILWPQDGQEL